MIGKLTLNADKSITVETEDELISYQFASFGARFGARLIDVLIIMIPSYFIPIIPSWLYWSLLQSGKDQSTIGQDRFGIKILSLDGSKISFGQATGRYFGNILNILTFFIGYIMFFFNDKNQCLHDYLSGCIVVKEIERSHKIRITE
ncbi:RDD family protein [Weeksellaceae bacterium KMM 9713]|uniref:RDD family protein n=1 Tax=Profundicola chukchiensis TaxID=2961959 RepID=A0A9X4MZ30_9FLAO|nr:RDD family protein [Profundicola chukchiensis]MDG4946240.1 RDD family protein [Profundicola chukchiensis]